MVETLHTYNRLKIMSSVSMQCLHHCFFLTPCCVLNCKDSKFRYFSLLTLCDMSKNLLIFEFLSGANIIYTALKKLLWQPFNKHSTTTLSKTENMTEFIKLSFPIRVNVNHGIGYHCCHCRQY